MSDERFHFTIEGRIICLDAGETEQTVRALDDLEATGDLTPAMGQRAGGADVTLRFPAL